MTFEQIIQQISARARIPRHAAKKAMGATLTTLAERLGARESARMAAQLPDPCKRLLSHGPRKPRDYSLDEFYTRVAGRADIGRGEAVKRSTVVMQALSEAISRRQMATVMHALPVEYDELLHV